MDSEKHVVSRMLTFVGAILILALGLGGLYFFVLTPGDQNSETLQRPQDGTLEQHTR